MLTTWCAVAMVVNFKSEADSILEEYPFLFQNYFTWGLRLDLKVGSQGYWFFPPRAFKVFCHSALYS